MRYVIVFLLVIILGCNNQDDFLIDSFRNCEQPLLDSDTLKAALIGVWELEEITCGQCSGEFPQKVGEIITVTFKADNTFLVENEVGEILEQNSWEIINNEFGASISVDITNESTTYLPGIIGICNNQLFADQTFIDLAGYLYVRKD